MSWRNDPTTYRQRQYIRILQDKHPTIPPFAGCTKGEAADYISFYKSRSFADDIHDALEGLLEARRAALCEKKEEQE